MENVLLLSLLDNGLEKHIYAPFKTHCFSVTHSLSSRDSCYSSRKGKTVLKMKRKPASELVGFPEKQLGFCMCICVCLYVCVRVCVSLCGCVRICLCKSAASHIGRHHVVIHCLDPCVLMTVYEDRD